MKIDQIPEIYLEQYILDELPENLQKEMDILILENPELKDRITQLLKSNESILFAYPVQTMTKTILDKNADQKKTADGYTEEIQCLEKYKSESAGFINTAAQYAKKIINHISSISARRYTLSIASAAMMILVIIFMIPGIRNTGDIITADKDTVRIKGLDSKLLLYRMKGREVEELKNLDTAVEGDIIQIGYIATGTLKYGVILSIDGRGSVTLHLPNGNGSGNELTMNRKILLNTSYELDDSPSFEKFFMILSSDPIDTTGMLQRAKKLANNRGNSVNGLITGTENYIQFSVTLNKSK